jgi:hypothetical protein
MFSGGGGGGGEEEQRWFAARNGGSCCGVMGVLPLLLVPLFFCFFLSLLLLCFYSSSFLSPIFSISGLFFSLSASLFLSFYWSLWGKSGERGLLPLSSHGTGVGSGRAATGQLPAGVVPSVFFVWWQVTGLGFVSA